MITGAITEDYVICPWHNAKFRLTDGECINGNFIMIIFNIIHFIRAIL